MKRDLFESVCGGLLLAFAFAVIIAIVQLTPVKSRKTIVNEREYRSIEIPVSAP